MKKNFTVNISGLLFHIDEDAFEALNHYLNRLRTHFAGNPGRDEIIADIEGRLAEMFQERSAGNGGIISYDIVKEVTSLMGDPTEFVDEGSETDSSGSNQPKRIFRDAEEKYLGGVCGGLGAYFNIDPLWFRIGFVILTLVGGSGILIYAVLWIAVPTARTTSDRLRMRGEKVNISNIERSLKEEFNGIRDSFRDMNYPGKKKSGSDNAWNEILQNLSNGLGQILRFLGAVFGAVLLVFGMLTGIALILLTQVSDGQMFGGFVPSSDLRSFMDWIALSGHDAGLLAVATILLVFTPIVILIYSGLRLLFGKQVRIPSAYSVLFSILIISSIVMAFLAIRITSDLREDHAETSVEEAIVTGPDRKVTLMLRDDDTTLMRDDDTYSYFLFDEEARLPIVRDGSSYTGMAELEIHPTRDSAATIQVVREALGASRKNATQNTLQIPYHVQCDSGKCVIAGTFTFNSPEGWRNQRLRYVVRLPESYILEINKNSKQILTVPEEFKPSSPLLLINSNGRIRSMRTDNPKAASEPHGGHTLEMM